MNEQDFTPLEDRSEESTPKDADGEKKQKNALLVTACILSAISILLLLISPILSMLGALLPRGDYPTPNPNPTVQGEDISDEALAEAMDSTVIVSCGVNVGTGVIIRNDGYIITNYHVVKDGKDLSVTLRESGKRYVAEIVGHSDRIDVAVLKIEAFDLPLARFASSDAVRYGEKVYAIGMPTGADFGWSVTHGIVSCPKREIKTYTDDGKLEKTSIFIQTDAAVDHGNSGGALINVRGEVIGIVTLRHSKGDRMGFAIPADKALEEAIKIIKRNQ